MDFKALFPKVVTSEESAVPYLQRFGFIADAFLVCPGTILS